MRPTVAVRKAGDALLRFGGQAPEHRAARRLGAVESKGSGPKVLFLTPRSWAAHVQWEAMIGRALAARGASVAFSTCGGGRQVCDRTHVTEGPPMPCRSCAGYTHRSLKAHGHAWQPLHGGRLGVTEPAWPELDELDLSGLGAAIWRGVPLGELVRAPVCWYLCTTDLERDPLAPVTYRRFLRAAAAIADEVGAALDEHQPATVVMLNGMFLFERVANDLCRHRDIDVVTYERGYLQDTVFFTRGVPACRYETAELWERFRDRPLTSAQEAELDEYLSDRQVGARSVYDLWPAPSFDEPARGFSVVFTNVTWDTAAQERERCFSSPREWLLETLDWFAAHPEHRVVVRSHPAEIRIPRARSREPVEQVIAHAMPELPPNISVLAPDDPTSSYPLMRAADVALVYSSTAGLEAVLAGTPCLTAATTQYGGKGFTIDPEDRNAYFDALARVVEDPLGRAVDTVLARRYAHFFFFRAMLRSAAWMREPIAGLARITDDPAVLAPGGDSDLDVICRGILEKQPFVRGDIDSLA